MRAMAGKVFSFLKDNRPRAGLTISQTLFMEKGRHMTVFSLAKDTEISEEYYPEHYGYFVLEGTLVIESKGQEKTLNDMEGIFLPPKSTYMLKAPKDVIYIEIEYQEEMEMNLVNANEIFSLKNLLPVESGKIINTDLINNDAVKIVVMSFDAGCALPEHAANGEALFFCLDGEGVIRSNGIDFPIKAGENFVFAPGELHTVTAVTPFKMALVLVKKS